jgi:hypothetical protein
MSALPDQAVAVDGTIVQMHDRPFRNGPRDLRLCATDNRRPIAPALHLTTRGASISRTQITAYRSGIVAYGLLANRSPPIRSPTMSNPFPSSSNVITAWYHEAEEARRTGHVETAQACLDRILAHDPRHAGALAAGRYEEAWPYFEDRWVNFLDADGRPASERTQLPLPEWNGGHPHVANCANGPNSASVAQGPLASEARLLVLPEQGHGDSLQFVRYLPLALARFSRVGYICPPPLRRLYEESLCAHRPGLVMLDDAFPETGDWDWQCSLMSLPMAFGTRLDNIPAATYLYADSRRAAQWGTRLAALPNPELPRVGVVWAGGHSGFTDDKARSLMCAQIAPLLALPHVRWISLQKTDDPAKRADAANAARLIDWTDEIADFADTAALIENLDLVISVDTSVAHLAAAMGKPVWLLNRFAGCWRWLRDRDDSPWYPSVRIFTQLQRDNWNDVLEQVAAALPIQGKPDRTFVR